VAAISQLLKLPWPGLMLLLIGGVAYSVGAAVYALRRPDPFPRVLGYHEVFHLLTLVAVGCQYAAIAFYVLPRG
jgi:hemolysin III